MEYLQPITIQLHLVTGQMREFYQSNPDLIDTICNGLDSRVFTQPTLIIESKDDVITFAGHNLIGISILTEQVPKAISLREDMMKTVVTQIPREDYDTLRLKSKPQIEGVRSNILSEIVFSNGQELYLEFSELRIGGAGERAEMHHLFVNPSIACRRLGGGFSLWNTAQIVSWTHSPKLEVPQASWQAEEIGDHEIALQLPPMPTPAKLMALL